nr:hypothetical protein DWF04_02320 [Cereibacter sphaeroides f. sp. denitrificans]
MEAVQDGERPAVAVLLVAWQVGRQFAPADKGSKLLRNREGARHFPCTIWTFVMVSHGPFVAELGAHPLADQGF